MTLILNGGTGNVTITAGANSTVNTSNVSVTGVIRFSDGSTQSVLDFGKCKLSPKVNQMKFCTIRYYLKLK